MVRAVSLGSGGPGFKSSSLPLGATRCVWWSKNQLRPPRLQLLAFRWFGFFTSFRLIDNILFAYFSAQNCHSST